jgi:hypothetical protein
MRLSSWTNPRRDDREQYFCCQRTLSVFITQGWPSIDNFSSYFDPLDGSKQRKQLFWSNLPSSERLCIAQRQFLNREPQRFTVHSTATYLVYYLCTMHTRINTKPPVCPAAVQFPIYFHFFWMNFFVWKHREKTLASDCLIIFYILPAKLADISGYAIPLKEGWH